MTPQITQDLRDQANELTEEGCGPTDIVDATLETLVKRGYLGGELAIWR